MKTNRIVIAVAGFLIAATLAGLAAARTAQSDSARLALEAAKKKEVVDGDLDAAIQQYREIVSRYGSDRPAAAEALLGIAGCYQKLGRADARGIYEQVIRDYADQQAAVALARTRMAALGPAPNTPTAPATPANGGRGSIAPRVQITLFDRQGKVLGKVGDPVPRAGNMAISPDGRRIARGVPAEGVYVHDIAANTVTQLVSQVGANSPVFWSPDGTRLGFQTRRLENGNAIYVVPANGSGSPELLYEPVPDFKGAVWSRDGRFVVYHGEGGAGYGMDLWVLPLTPDAKPRPLLRTAAVDVAARVSPDGRFIAYRSDESRQDDIYVRPFDPSGNPEPGPTAAKWKISTAGSNGVARWHDDGKELYFLAVNGDFMVVDVDTTSTFKAGPPRVLFTTPQAFRTAGTPGQFADVSSDGKMFALMLPLQP